MCCYYLFFQQACQHLKSCFRVCQSHASHLLNDTPKLVQVFWSRAVHVLPIGIFWSSAQIGPSQHFSKSWPWWSTQAYIWASIARTCHSAAVGLAQLTDSGQNILRLPWPHSWLALVNYKSRSDLHRAHLRGCFCVSDKLLVTVFSRP